MALLTEVKPPQTQDVDCSCTASLTPDVAHFFDHVIWGTEGALYQMKGFEKTLDHLPMPQCLTLRKDGKLLAVRLAFHKTVLSDTGPIPCYYHSMFAVLPSERGHGYGKALAKATLEHLLPKLGNRGLIYAYVEEGNKRSETISRSLGYQRIGSFYTTAFSRLFPRDSDHLMPLDVEDAALMIRRLTSQYRPGHALLDFDFSLRPDAYWIYTDAQGIAAGIQVDPQQWVIRSLGGFGGTVALKALPHVPVLNGVFNPADFRFLKIGNIYFRKGQEKTLFRLVEAVLARYHLKTAMAYFDLRSPVYQALARAGTFGILNPLTRTKVNVFGYFHHLTPTEIAALSRQPLVISPFDV